MSDDLKIDPITEQAITGGFDPVRDGDLHTRTRGGKEEPVLPFWEVAGRPEPPVRSEGDARP